VSGANRPAVNVLGCLNQDRSQFAGLGGGDGIVGRRVHGDASLDAAVIPTYAPIHCPGDTFTRTTSAAVTGGQLVYVSGDNTVAPTSAATAAWLGVAAADAASGADVTVYTEGVHQLASSGTIKRRGPGDPCRCGRCRRPGDGQRSQ